MLAQFNPSFPYYKHNLLIFDISKSINNVWYIETSPIIEGYKIMAAKIVENQNFYILAHLKQSISNIDPSLSSFYYSNYDIGIVSSSF